MMGAMQRYFQTIRRIFFGLSSLSVLLLHLWPATEYVFSDRIESFLYFLVSLGIWIGAEFKDSEEVIFRRSTQNDIRLARRVIWLARNSFRELLAESNYRTLKPQDAVNDLTTFALDWILGVVFFQDSQLDKEFQSFAAKLNEFDSNLSFWGSSRPCGSNFAYRIAPQDFDSLSDDPPEPWKSEIQEANKQAAELNADMIKLVALIKKRVPEAFDTEITQPA